MTNEQREAIDSLGKLVKLRKDKTNTIKHDTCICGTMDLDTALSLIKEQQEYLAEIAKALNLKEDATIDEIYIAISILKSKRINVIEQLDCIQKKDKQIDLMAEYISKQDVEEDICMKNKTSPEWCNKDYTNCEDCIKQYFADLIEKE